MLEAHIVTLRMGFDHFLQSEPEEPESSAPTEEEVAAFEAEEERHGKLFKDIEHLAQKLSNSLAVGKLTDVKLKRSMLGFMTEGVRYSFDGNTTQEEDDLLLGSRLPFLLILQK